jgi:hypothetical protein
MEALMRNIVFTCALFSIALSVLLSVSCTSQGLEDQEFPVGSLENPLILDDYSELDSQIAYSGTIGNEKLYIKVINIPYFNTNHTVELQADNDLDLYTYYDAFVTLQESSTSSGASESCTGTATATGELYIMVDGTKTTSHTTFQLTAGI